MLLVCFADCSAQAIAESLSSEKDLAGFSTNGVCEDENTCDKKTPPTQKLGRGNKPVAPTFATIGPPIVAESKSSEIAGLQANLDLSIQVHAGGSPQDRCATLYNYSDKSHLFSTRTDSKDENKLSPISMGMREKRRIAEAAYHRNQEILRERRKQEREIQHQAGVTPEDVQRREQQLKEQRDRIIAKKNKERKQRLGEKHKQAKQDTQLLTQDTAAGQSICSKQVSDERPPSDLEERRSMMRLALTRRMKKELLESEEERLRKLQSEQFTELDHKLRLVEQLRDENRAKEMQLADAIEAQQTQRFKNIQLSAAQLTKHF